MNYDFLIGFQGPFNIYDKLGCTILWGAFVNPLFWFYKSMQAKLTKLSELTSNLLKKKTLMKLNKSDYRTTFIIYLHIGR